jgi:hypothetical protein
MDRNAVGRDENRKSDKNQPDDDERKRFLHGSASALHVAL